MRNLTLSTAALNQTALDFDGNTSRILRAIEIAKSNNSQILCLPELAICGYGCEDEFFSLSLAARCEAAVQEIVEYTDGIMTVLGCPIYLQGELFNCAVVVKDKKVLGISAKKSLAREGLHYEPRWFTPWVSGKKVEIEYAGQKNVDFGDLYFRVGNVGVGIEICEEAWGPEQSLNGVSGACEIVLNLSASHFAIGKNNSRRQLIADASRALCVVYAYSNLLGVDSGKSIYDGSCFIGFNGKILVESSRFALDDVVVHCCAVDLNLVRVYKLRQNSSSRLGPSGLAPYAVRTEAFSNQFEGIAVHREIYAARPSPEREFHDSITLALFDYMRKTHSKGYTVSLSGGCDSSATAYLVASMVHRGVDELGLSEFCRKTGFEPGKFSDKKSLVAEILTCIYQSSANSSQVTEHAATELAKELSATFIKSSVKEVVDIYTAQAEKVMGRKLTWEADDVTLQNIQARARAPFPWMMANIKSHILLTTSNRSEVSVGYATMDGDSAGGLAPIAGINKAFLRRWLVWAEKDCDSGIGAVKSLGLVNSQQPTAELRPASAQQQDEKDLMPYEVLNHIERYMVRDKMGTSEIAEVLAKDFPAIDRDLLEQHVLRFRTLWRQSQWKRERFASSFHVDDYSLDPNSWCRFPIISGS